MKYFLLPPTDEVWGKVIFSQTSVILLTGGSASVHAGIHPPPRRPPCQGNLPCQGDPPTKETPTKETPLQAHTQGGNWGGSDPGPHPRGKLRGIRSRPTPKGAIQGDQIQAHTQGGKFRGIRCRPTSKWEIQGDQDQTPPQQLLLQVVRILLECILVIDVFIVELRWCRWDMAMEQVNGTFAFQIEVQTRMHFSRMRTTWFSGCIYRGAFASGSRGVSSSWSGGVSGSRGCLPLWPKPSSPHPTTPSPHPLYHISPCGQTNTCENITFPQTSFAGGKNWTHGP